jgi:hypothetical protein
LPRAIKAFVIPAQTGIQTESRVCGDMSLFRAAARRGWIPACAGMTNKMKVMVAAG